VEAMQHIKDIAHVIEQVDADIIHLSEVESCHVLDVLLSCFKKPIDYRGYIVQAPWRHGTANQNVALITKVDPILPLTRTDLQIIHDPTAAFCDAAASMQAGAGILACKFSYSTCHPSTPKYPSLLAKHYLAELSLPIYVALQDAEPIKNLNLILLGVHLTAFPTWQERCFEREAQAHIISHLVRRNYQDAIKTRKFLFSAISTILTQV
jgi:hypothetical protein